MRKITQQAAKAFHNKQNFKKSNTEVYRSDLNKCTYLTLFGNTIATLLDNGTLLISNCGYQNNTTKERLNGLNNVSVTQKNFFWYLNGKEWDGSLIEIK